MLVHLYHPAFWLAHGHWDYLQQTPGGYGIWKGVTYTINNSHPPIGDFVVVHEDIDQPMKVRASSLGFVLVASEERSIKQYHPEFINQFDLIITSRDDLQHPNIISCNCLHPWWVKKSYDELTAMNCPDKTKTLSAIISNFTTLASHKERFAFINKLKGHYKDDLHWFSKGEKTFLPDKWDGLAPYRYSIAIENSSHANYFTEKINDCFLAFTLPFYSGCPNIKDFFDDRSFISINTSDFKSAIEVINSTIQENLHDKNLSFIKESRVLVLEKYHFVASLTDILRQQTKQLSKTTKTIRPQSYFSRGKVERFVKESVKKLMGR